MVLDWYFKRPVLIDLIISSLSTGGVFYLYYSFSFNLPDPSVLLSLTGDLSTVALTFAGFILTLLTILITFKAGAKIPTDDTQHLVPLFEIFFSTPLYFKTITLLKNAIKSLIVTAMLGYIFKLTLHGDSVNYLFYFDIGLIIIITLTLWRNLTILSLIMALQKKKPD